MLKWDLDATRVGVAMESKKLPARGVMQRATVVLVVMVLSCTAMVAGCVAGQGEGEKVTVRTPSKETASEVKVGDLYAVVVGVSKYAHPRVPPLTFADKDARDFAEFLKTQNKLFKNVYVTLLTNEQATRRAVETQLIYGLRRAGKDDTVIVFLSGHGADDPHTHGEFFFLTCDADPDVLGASAVHMNRQWFMSKLDSKRVLLIADACHAGGFASITSKALVRSRENLLRMFRESEGKLFLASSRPDEVSEEKREYGNGLFTYHMLEGLLGKADGNSDGIITIRELYEYVYSKTKADSKGFQSPQMEGQVVGTFPVAVLRVPDIPRPDVPTGTAPIEPKPDELAALRARADAGDVKAQLELAIKYEFGFGVAEDPAEAVKWYFKATAQGDKKAQEALARLGVRVTSVAPPEQGPSRTPVIPSGSSSQGASSSRAPSSDDMALWAAAAGGNTREVQRLISWGADVNAKDMMGGTALDKATTNGHAETVGFLLNQGADVNSRDKGGRTALDIAVDKRLWEIVKVLQHFGGRQSHVAASVPTASTRPVSVPAIPAAKAASKELALWAAAAAGDNDKVRRLISEGADVNAKDMLGGTAMEKAAANGHTATVQLLLDERGEINARNADGRTVLHLAAFKGHVDTVQLLLARGADVRARGQERQDGP
jgi:ankyrin repeat protein/uncharacterized caspase-like protein